MGMIKIKGIWYQEGDLSKADKIRLGIIQVEKKVIEVEETIPDISEEVPEILKDHKKRTNKKGD